MTKEIIRSPMRGQMKAELTGLRSGLSRLVAPLLIAASVSLTGAVNADDSSSLSGAWRSDDGTTIVNIAPCGSSAKRLCGDVVWSDEQSETAVGDTYLKSFTPVGRSIESDKWVKGRVLANGSRRGYDGQLDVDGDKLVVSYCKGSTCFKTNWSRASTQELAAAGIKAGS